MYLFLETNNDSKMLGGIGMEKDINEEPLDNI